MKELNAISSGRNYGIDALRILSMLMIVVLHIVGYGGILTTLDASSVKYQSAFLLQSAVYCAVNCYALISGYVGVNSKYRYSNLALVWLRVLFYTVIITAVMFIIFPDTRSLRVALCAVLPVFTNQYWYITAYFAIFFFIPVINKAVSTMSKKQAVYLSVSLVTVFSVLQTVLKQPFGTSNGYSAIWLLILYIIGACIKHFDLLSELGKLKAFIGCAVCVFVSWGYTALNQFVLAKTFENNAIIQGAFAHFNFVNYTSPTILFAAIFLLLLFRQIRFGSVAQKVISVASPLALSVYLIHTHPLVFTRVFYSRFAAYVNLPTPIMIICIIATAVAIFVACAMVDELRELLFRALKVKKRLNQLESKLTKSPWNE